MKKNVILSLLFMTNSFIVYGQCSSLFTHTVYNTFVAFQNQSTTTNTHFFWNFGDGTSSNMADPTHMYSEIGDYFVTLFAKDTLSNCSSFYEYWINITKISPNNCQPVITDSFYFYNNNDWLKIINNSTSCNAYSPRYDFGKYVNYTTGGSYNLRFNGKTRAFRRVRFMDNSNNVLQRENYKSILYNYTSSKNYGNCSANFEFKVVSEDMNGQRILFKAMNNNAAYYEWNLTVTGNPIISNNDTISHYYPFNPTNPFNYLDFAPASLKTIDANGCRDSLFQVARVVNPNVHTSIYQLKEHNAITISPNPATSIINIVDEQNNFQKSTIEIINSIGQTVLITKFSTQIDISELQSGIYFLTISTRAIKKTIKIIKQ